MAVIPFVSIVNIIVIVMTVACQTVPQIVRKNLTPMIAHAVSPASSISVADGWSVLRRCHID